MSEQSAYSYTILRYFHDVAAGEFANVGVAVYSRNHKFLGARCKSTFGRLARMFPGIDGEYVKSTLRQIEHSIGQFGNQIANELDFGDLPETVLGAVHMVLPHDDSALQWSALGSGVTKSPELVVSRLFERFVSRYEEKSAKRRRTDDEIWSAFKKELDAQKVTHLLTPKTISAADDEVEFPYAWKNGAWHCVEPLSFDLASADGMKEKAHKWLGQIKSLEDSAEKFKVYFLVGGPRSETLKKGYHQAVKILEKGGPCTHVVKEDEAAEFSKRFSSQIRRHEKTISEECV